MSVIEGALGTPLQFAGTPGVGTDAVQTLTVGATSGQYRLTFEGFTTADIAFNANAAAIDAALEALPSVGAGGVAVTGASSPFTITFGGNLARRLVGVITVSPGTTPFAGGTVTIANTTPGVTAFGRGVGRGALVQDTVNGRLHVNTGTALVPIWTVVGTQT
ncbi:MAG TPA: hypothetical protein VLM76_11710 [Patescibacteria group bacterium]|nr:hypothetical protein [Patescibacteria group bacterium]